MTNLQRDASQTAKIQRSTFFQMKNSGKPQQPHSDPIATTVPTAQLHCFTTNLSLYRHQTNKKPWYTGLWASGSSQSGGSSLPSSPPTSRTPSNHIRIPQPLPCRFISPVLQINISKFLNSDTPVGTQQIRQESRSQLIPINKNSLFHYQQLNKPSDNYLMIPL